MSPTQLDELEQMLLLEHSKEQRNQIINFIGEDEALFALLMKLFLKTGTKTSQRAAWPVGVIGEQKPHWLAPYYSKLLDLLARKDLHEAMRRNITRAFQFADIPARYQGRLMDQCFRFITDPAEAAAVKAFSLTILENLAGLHPEIIPELILAIKESFDRETPAFQSRSRHILKRLARDR